MDYFRLTGLTSEAKSFLSEWNSSAPYVTAHTSGSTGKPKEIKLLKEDMFASARATNAFFGITEQSVLALPLSASYIAGKMMIVRAMAADCRLLIEPPSLNPLSTLGKDIELDLVPIVPAQLPGLLDSGIPVSSMRSVIIGGAPLGRLQEKMVINSGMNAFATYGMTETCSHVALRRIGKEDFYTALPGISFSTDSRGCLVINAPSFSFGTLVTNDCVALLSSDTFRWLGRADNVINTGGIKVYAENLEKQLSPLIGDHAFYISGRESARWGTEIVMTVETSDGFDTSAFLSAAANVIDRRLLPKEIFVVDAIERTASGKIIRSSRSARGGSASGTR